MNWRGQPLVSYRVIVDLIARHDHRHRPHGALRTRHQPSIPKGIAVSDEEMAAINITRDDFHGEWNYTIAPNSD